MDELDDLVERGACGGVIRVEEKRVVRHVFSAVQRTVHGCSTQFGDEGQHVITESFGVAHGDERRWERVQWFIPERKGRQRKLAGDSAPWTIAR
jgi:hypothetical protein